MLTLAQFKKIFPNSKDARGWIDAFSVIFPAYQLDTPKRQAAFLAQCGHESGGWRVFSENLNYSAAGLNAVFPKYFKRVGRDANVYARNPEAIANVVYADRMGNDCIDSGDGWKYRGRGPIQLTGADNYESFGDDMNIDISDPDVVQNNKEVALLSALWFWHKNDLNDFADHGDIKKMTRKINGGYNGLEDRVHHYNELLNAITGKTHILETEEDDDDSTDYESFGVIRRGSTGEGVKAVQEALGLSADGIFGRGTEAAVKSWQKLNRLVVDGIVGPNTLDILL